MIVREFHERLIMQQDDVSILVETACILRFATPRSPSPEDESLLMRAAQQDFTDLVSGETTFSHGVLEVYRKPPTNYAATAPRVIGII